MRNHNDGGISAAAGKCGLASFLEARIPYGGYFVDKVTLELDSHRQAKCQASHHPGGVGPHRGVDVIADFGKIFHKAGNPYDVFAIGTGYEIEVLLACHEAVEASRETERPGYSDIFSYRPRIRKNRAGNHSQCCGFSRAVDAQDTVGIVAVKFEIDLIENDLLVLLRLEMFGNILEPDHGGTYSLWSWTDAHTSESSDQNTRNPRDMSNGETMRRG